MTAVALLTAEDDKSRVELCEREVEGISYDPTGSVVGLSAEKLAGRGMEQLAAVCTMCNDAEISYNDGAFTRVGEPTEAALKVSAPSRFAPSRPSSPSSPSTFCPLQTPMSALLPQVMFP